MEGYAVSAQCMALVRDNCLLPTKDAPELGYVRESSDKQFVPDVYYKVSNFFCLVFMLNERTAVIRTVLQLLFLSINLIFYMGIMEWEL